MYAVLSSLIAIVFFPPVCIFTILDNCPSCVLLEVGINSCLVVVVESPNCPTEFVPTPHTVPSPLSTIELSVPAFAWIVL